eukprot:TRINITY_DN10_c0_g1_i2.p1 TRINITY_DN10_c0_g1~~TRINITY_DN10_c0_g1_i2.p1  ORF type:complete len:679 (-),score=78.75 TRINITY_DN10_c0_g1_i2:333-2369(-)
MKGGNSNSANPSLTKPLISSSNGYEGTSGRWRAAFLWILYLLMWAFLIIWITLIFLYPFPFARQWRDVWYSYTQNSFLGKSGSILLLYGLPVLLIALLGALYLEISPKEVNNQFMLELIGLRLGIVGQFCLGFLFFPVARGSILLRLMNIPFEHATKYHVWLGHVTMGLFTAHGLCYIVAWGRGGKLAEEMSRWQDIGIAVFPGVISLSAGLAMWVTSLHYVRKHYFELFFYTHQLYIVFVVFLALHVGDFIFCIAATGIFFFLLDRFIRFCQSRNEVDLHSARCLPCGTVELVISKPPGLCYNALSFVFIQIRNLSWLQWHPFSVSSSPYDGKNHLSILIKPLGTWTHKLSKIVPKHGDQPKQCAADQCPKKLKVSVEGPYGHEIAYHLSYKTLILVAGGIGISPFIAILRDLLHRTQQGELGLPKTILLVWAVKKSKELSILDLVDETSICPNYSEKMDLIVQVYVTQETEPDLENHINANKIHCFSNGNLTKRQMSYLVGTGNIIWACIYLVSSVIGFLISMALVKTFIFSHYSMVPWWLKGLYLFLSMVVGIIIFGGASLLLWNMWECRLLKNDQKSEDGSQAGDDSLSYYQEKPISEDSKKLIGLDNIKYGCRPNFKEIFEKASEAWENVDVGVMVCGPPTLQSSVAKECRSFNLKNCRNRVVFHFNSHSFDL